MALLQQAAKGLFLWIYRVVCNFKEFPSAERRIFTTLPLLCYSSRI
jgi:hypothetical protein